MIARRRVPRKRLGARAGAALTVLLATGCVDRALFIDSSPPGARVTINGHPAGVTPTGPVRFDHYGTYEILLERDGYVPLERAERLATPWHGRFPLDFFAEVLWPGRIVDHRRFRYELTPLAPMTPAERKELIQNARKAKAEARGNSSHPRPDGAVRRD